MLEKKEESSPANVQLNFKFKPTPDVLKRIFEIIVKEAEEDGGI